MLYIKYKKKCSITKFLFVLFLIVFLCAIIPFTLGLEEQKKQFRDIKASAGSEEQDVLITKMQFRNPKTSLYYDMNSYPENLKEIKGDLKTISGEVIIKELPELALWYKNVDDSSAVMTLHWHYSEWVYVKEGETEKKPLTSTDELGSGVYYFTVTPGQGHSPGTNEISDYKRLNYDNFSEEERTIKVTINADDEPLKIVKSAEPEGITLNLFDYVSVNALGYPDNFLFTTWKELGINANHLLLFTQGGASETGSWNTNTWQSENKTEIVQRTLVDGYPYLNLDSFKDVTATDWETYNKGPKAESLDYLFNPEKEQFMKFNYENVTGLFQMDDDGYYYYDYRQNFAELEGGINAPSKGAKINLYNKSVITSNQNLIIKGEFFPFNSHESFFYEDGSRKIIANRDDVINHFFGLTLTVPFRQPENGKITNNIDSEKDMIYEFYGDDDVWIFIDDVLILDLGGTHSAISGTINFSTGEVTQSSNGLVTSIRERFREAGREDSVEWKNNTFYDNTNHTLKMFYLERGNFDSSMYVKFNLQTQLHQQIKKVDSEGKPLEGAKFELYQSDENGNKKSEVLSSLVTDKNGNATFRTLDGKIMNFGDRYSASSSNKYYILEEVTAPEGYRKSIENIILEYYPEEDILKVVNRYVTGAYSSFDNRIRGNNKVNFANFDESENSTVSTDIQLSNSYQENGLVLAIPLVKQNKTNNWVSVYGNNYDGYNSFKIENNNEESFKQAVLKAALYQVYLDKDSSWKLTWNSEKEVLDGELHELPGSAERYLYKNPDGDMRLEYIAISPSFFEKIGIENTTQSLSSYLKEQVSDSKNIDDVISSLVNELIFDNSEEIANNKFAFVNLNNFERTFRSIIYIPNEIRELRVKKVDEDGKALNGAEFSLYYTIEDAQKNINPVSTGITTNINGEDGMLIFTPKPKEESGYAKISWNDVEVGEKFYLKETNTLKGYVLNETIIPIVVGQYSIYADAGTETDGVAVYAGVGKITQTMRKYATDDNINISLRDIIAYGQTQKSKNFEINGWIDNGEVMNLHYKMNNVIDYGLHDEGKYPYLKTTTGFLRTRVSQNYEAHQNDSYATGANKDQIDDDITSIFRLINIVEVSNIEQNRIISGIVFEDMDENDKYNEDNDIVIPNVKVTLLNEYKLEEATTLTDATGFYKFENLNRSNYYVKFELLEGTIVIEKNTNADSSKANKDGYTDKIEFITSDLRKIAKIDNVNLGVRSLKIIFTKIEGNDESKPLKNAGLFELYEYKCDLGDEAYESKMVNEKPECFEKIGDSISSDAEGKIKFFMLKPTVYRLVEVEAPAGFKKPNGEWNIAIDEHGNNNISCVEIDGKKCPAFKVGADNSLYLPNYRINDIPSSGGIGNVLFTVVGIVLMGTGTLLLKGGKKHKI